MNRDWEGLEGDNTGAGENPQVPKCLRGRVLLTDILNVFFSLHLLIWEQSMPGPLHTCANQKTLSGVASLLPCMCRSQGQWHELFSADSFPPHCPNAVPETSSFVPIIMASHYTGIRTVSMWLF